MLLDKAVLSKVFTKPHLASGYHQIAMKGRSIYRTGVHHSYEAMGVFRHAVRAAQLTSNTSITDEQCFCKLIDLFLFSVDGILVLIFMYDRFLDPPFLTAFLIHRSLTNTFSFLCTSAFVHLSFLISAL